MRSVLAEQCRHVQRFWWLAHLEQGVQGFEDVYSFLLSHFFDRRSFPVSFFGRGAKQTTGEGEQVGPGTEPVSRNFLILSRMTPFLSSSLLNTFLPSVVSIKILKGME